MNNIKLISKLKLVKYSRHVIIRTALNDNHEDGISSVEHIYSTGGHEFFGRYHCENAAC